MTKIETKDPNQNQKKRTHSMNLQRENHRFQEELLSDIRNQGLSCKVNKKYA